jgi:hypothetical protein
MPSIDPVVFAALTSGLPVIISSVITKVLPSPAPVNKWLKKARELSELYASLPNTTNEGVEAKKATELLSNEISKNVLRGLNYQYIDGDFRYDPPMIESLSPSVVISIVLISLWALIAISTGYWGFLIISIIAVSVGLLIGRFIPHMIKFLILKVRVSWYQKKISKLKLELTSEEEILSKADEKIFSFNKRLNELESRLDTIDKPESLAHDKVVRENLNPS